MNRRRVLFGAAVFALCLLCGCAQNASGADAVERIVDISTTQYFTDEAVKNERKC